MRAEPELREQAVAIVEGTPPLARVIAMNARAAEATIETGMTRTQSEERLRLAVGERGWEVRARSGEREQAAHAALLDAACAFSPRVEDTAADTLVLDLAGLERIFGPVTRIAREVARRCSELGMETNVAVAGNPEAAICAARGFPGVTVIAPGKEADRLGALPIEVLCGVCGTAALGCGTEIPMQGGRGMIDQGGRSGRVKRSRTGSGGAQSSAAELLEIFERWGIRTFRALATLPEIAVVERLGQQGLRLQQLARGAVQRPLVPAEPPLVFEESIELEYPVDLLEPLAFVLSRLLEQLCARLALRSLATNELTLRFTLDFAEDIAECRLPNADCDSRGPEQEHSNSTLGTRHSAFERTLRLPVPMCDAKVFLKLLQLDLKGNPPPAPVVKVWLRAEPVPPRVAQQGLFLPAAPQPDRLELTLKRIANVVGDSRLPGNGAAKPAGDVALDARQSAIGEARVGSAEVLDSHRPDAFRVNPFVVEDSDARRATTQHGDTETRREEMPFPSSSPCLRASVLNSNRESQCLSALRVFRPPLAVTVTMRAERPVAIACAERPRLRGEVTWCAGPWRMSGEWWEQSSRISDLRFAMGDLAANRDTTANHQSPITNRKFPGWAREEWDIAVENEDGTTLYRLYYDGAARAWFLFGSYD